MGNGVQLSTLQVRSRVGSHHCQFGYPTGRNAMHVGFQLMTVDLASLANLIFYCFLFKGISYAKLANLPPIIGLCKYANKTVNRQYALRINLKYIILYIWCFCRLQLRATFNLCCSRKLERSRCRTGIHRFIGDGIYVERSGFAR